MFKKDKHYIFDKNKFLKASENNEYQYGGDEITRSWVEKCSNKQIELVNENYGVIGEFKIIPKWCRQLRDK